MNAIELEQDLRYICPECDHEFYSVPWGIFTCPNCKVELDTDFIEDEYAGILGICRVIISDTQRSISITKG